MPTFETHSDKTLHIDVITGEAEVRLVWRGMSNAREPGTFLYPLLTRALELTQAGQKPLVLDFAQVAYLNSSTFSPLAKLLDQAARGQFRLTVEYAAAKKWQSLSFSALKTFETADGRITFRGK